MSLSRLLIAPTLVAAGIFAWGCGGDGDGSYNSYDGDWTFTAIPPSGYNLSDISVVITRNDRAVGSRPTDECRGNANEVYEPSAGWCEIDSANGRMYFRVTGNNQPYRVWVSSYDNESIPFTRVDLERERDGAGQTVELTADRIARAVWRVFNDDADLLYGDVVDERSIQPRPKLPFTRK